MIQNAWTTHTYGCVGEVSDHINKWELLLLALHGQCYTLHYHNFLLCHGRDIHPMWVMSLSIYDTKESEFCF